MLFLLLIPLAVLLAAACDARLIVRRYVTAGDGVASPVRLAVLADLHSCVYGEGQRTLLDAVASQAPDAVLLAGDIVDDEMPEAPAWTALAALAADYPCYYVTGNHEWWSGEAERMCARMESLGVTVLRGDCALLTAGETTLALCGVDDPASGASGQLEAAAGQLPEDTFSVLLAHRPEQIDEYLQYPFDLILSGHAHGGQWRIPGLLNGLFAPNQGLFPRYAGGLYQFPAADFIVSRGLARESTLVPRIFNRPELVVVDITPACEYGF